MTVGELIERLRTLSPRLQVVDGQRRAMTTIQADTEVVVLTNALDLADEVAGGEWPPYSDPSI